MIEKVEIHKKALKEKEFEIERMSKLLSSISEKLEHSKNEFNELRFLFKY